MVRNVVQSGLDELGSVGERSVIRLHHTVDPVVEGRRIAAGVEATQYVLALYRLFITTGGDVDPFQVVEFSLGTASTVVGIAAL